MRYRTLGQSGLLVSEVSLGTWRTFGAHKHRSTNRACVQAAIESGINLFDTANVYAGAEETLGSILRDFSRTEVVIASKCGQPMSEHPGNRGLSRRHIFDAIEGSLQRLGTDYLDLYQCHRFDPHTPVAETVAAMGELVRQGKIRYWGISRWQPAQVVEATCLARELGVAEPIAHQYFYNLLGREVEDELLPMQERLGMGTIGYGALAQGVLTGKYTLDFVPVGSRADNTKFRPGMWNFNARDLSVVERLHEVAHNAGQPLSRLAIAWCLRQPNISSALTGATSPAQVVSNAAAAEMQVAGSVWQAFENIVRTSR